ncbi:S-adenosylmethionine/tRNA-ribosyltransferase-isomerase [Stanieria sp. NIES-3757]|nr:S-adenosylmethionine/tRNA-ribosyltransferase-isomerase [Stanieria sp. NIES-3757]
MNPDQLLSSYGYELPSELIAQTPAVPRDSSRLLVVNSPTTELHRRFSDLIDWLLPGDLLVLNNTRVIPARLYGHKATGAPVEILLLEEKKDNCWLALVKPGKRFKLGTEIYFDSVDNSITNKSGFKAQVIERDEATGGRILQFFCPEGTSFWQMLEEFGQVPLPPYINSESSQSESSSLPFLSSQYQTIFAQQPGAIAAPTAGLHFTEELLQKLQAKGIAQAYLTLHVGVGTFRPVEVENITDHVMHQEWIELPLLTVDQINATKARGGRIIAVGTTVVRALEGAAKAAQNQSLKPFRGKTDLFIYPGYRWQVVDGLITNFHLPYSSLLMLVSALIGRERLLALYDEAIAKQYRFYSFGDAMLILPEAKLS